MDQRHLEVNPRAIPAWPQNRGKATLGASCAFTSHKVEGLSSMDQQKPWWSFLKSSSSQGPFLPDGEAGGCAGIRSDQG